MKRLGCYARMLSALVGSITLITISLVGYSTFNSIPEMTNVEIYDYDEPCTLDEAISECESVIARNKEYLDMLLMQAESDNATIMIESDFEVALAYAPESEMESESESESETEVETETDPEHFIPDIEIIKALEPTTEPESEFVSESIIETLAPPTFTPVASMMNPDLQRWTYDYCTSQGIDPYIIMAICERESCCIANIYGDNGKAYGMMQIQVRWVQDRLAAHGLTNEDLMYAQNNIMIGSEIYNDYVKEGQGVRYALMKYNGGPTLVGTPSTQEYADWVINRATELRGYPL